jgi:AGCS family alanine or glycine:cation symporter
VAPDGTVAGGPMYTLLYGLKMRRTAAAFAVFALIASFGIGNMVQANSVMDGLGYLFPELHESAWLVGVLLAICVGMVILGGVKRIARVASTLVPFMAILYMAAALLVLISHASDIKR